LYGWAPLIDEDFPLLTDLFEVKREDGNAKGEKTKDFFALPCKLCLNDRCSVHDEVRPAICGDYQCKLLANHGSGKVTTEAARSLIENVKRLRDRLIPQMEKFVEAECALPLFQLTQLATDKLEKMNDIERLSVSPGMLLDIAMMRVLLAKNFDSRLMKHTYLADKAQLAMEDTSAQPQQPETDS